MVPSSTPLALAVVTPQHIAQPPSSILISLLCIEHTSKACVYHDACKRSQKPNPLAQIHPVSGCSTPQSHPLALPNYALIYIVQQALEGGWKSYVLVALLYPRSKEDRGTRGASLAHVMGHKHVELGDHPWTRTTHTNFGMYSPIFFNHNQHSVVFS